MSGHRTERGRRLESKQYQILENGTNIKEASIRNENQERNIPEDSVSPLTFVLGMTPLSEILQKTKR